MPLINGFKVKTDDGSEDDYNDGDFDVDGDGNEDDDNGISVENNNTENEKFQTVFYNIQSSSPFLYTHERTLFVHICNNSKLMVYGVSCK